MVTDYIEIEEVGNVLSACIAERNLKAVLVAQFIIRWGMEEALTHYDISLAEAHAVMAFYHGNKIEILAQQNAVIDEIKAVGVDVDEKISEMRSRLNQT